MPPPSRVNFTQLEQAQADLPVRFALLGVFPADYSFSWDEARALWAPAATPAANVEESLALLRRWQLVEPVPGAAAIYRLPRAIYQAAQEYLATHPDVRAQGEQRLIDYYTAFAAAHNGDSPEAISQIADVYEVAGNALTWAEQAGRWDAVIVLARALSRFFYARQMTDEY